MTVKRYHYCIRRHRLNSKPEYADGFLDVSVDQDKIKSVIGAGQYPPWVPDEFVVISLNPIE